jgi:hypothetical protein
MFAAACAHNLFPLFAFLSVIDARKKIECPLPVRKMGEEMKKVVKIF